ncbi:MAG: DUF4143 domain-containing protein [Bifidobacteriaceae bacterium]|jgi:predicted AAA+ superfamily ATPase|nr:DUF4143 domain-containing protein [Bifidobacteriaceae bacterium]
MSGYVPRLADKALRELFEDVPAVSIVGPRGCGKTTTASRLVPNVVHVDQRAVAQAFQEDADAALRAVGEPVVLDEWQAAPDILGAVKRAVDAGGGAGRFLLTGSVGARLTTQEWPGTGRVVELRMAPITAREMHGNAAHDSLTDRLFSPDAGALLTVGVTRATGLAIDDYLDIALAGGFPEGAAVPARSRGRWFASYLDQVVNRDSQLAAAGIDTARFGRYLAALGLHSATVTTDQRLAEMAAVSAATAAGYERLLDRLHLLATVPAWASSRVKRLARTPKRLLADSALAAALMGEDRAGLMLAPDLRGRVVETWAVAQLMAELPVDQSRTKLFHLRDSNGRHEVDLLLERPGGRVVGVEVKASSSVTKTDVKHLMWLRDELGDSFVRGVVLHAGPIARELGDRILAVPLSVCWE